MAELEARIVVHCHNVLGESVTWHPALRRVLWVDIQRSEWWSLDPLTGAASPQKMAERVTCYAPRRAGGFLVGFASGFALFDPATGWRKDLAAFEPELPHTRPNDGRTDRQGRFICGGFDEVEGKFISSVVRVDPNGQVTTLFGGVACANGICFSPDGRTLYFADSPARTIWAFDYDIGSGQISNRRVLTGFEGQPGIPDGSCVDAEGYIWNAQWNGHRVVRYSPDGRVERIVSVPVLNPSCVAFGGDDLSTLYITTARYQMSPAQLAAEPDSGALFACVPGVKGLADTPYAG
jgi:L-arabinonolactonase